MAVQIAAKVFAMLVEQGVHGIVKSVCEVALVHRLGDKPERVVITVIDFDLLHNLSLLHREMA